MRDAWGGRAWKTRLAACDWFPKGKNYGGQRARTRRLGFENARRQLFSTIFDGSGLRLACTMTAWLRDKALRLCACETYLNTHNPSWKFAADRLGARTVSVSSSSRRAFSSRYPFSLLSLQGLSFDDRVYNDYHLKHCVGGTGV